MRVYRGRGATPEADREVTADLLARVAEGGGPAVRVWAPHRQVAFGRRDANAEDYPEAVAAAERRGYRCAERSVGGRAVAYTGRTLAFARATPLDDMRRGMDDRYAAAVETLVGTLSDLGADVEPGEPADSYCPGDHSVRVAGGGKVAGVAQRVRRGAALVSGCLTVARADEAEQREVLTPVYAALGVPFDPASVGSVAGAGGPDDPERVARALEAALVGDAETTVVRADERERER